MKKPLVYFLFATLSLVAVTGCQKKEEIHVQTKEEAMAALAEKAVIPYEGGEKIVYKTFDGKKLKSVYSQDPYSFRDEIPQRRSNEKYHYDFSGWNVTYDFENKETIATAQYEKILNEYEVRFMDGDQIINTQMVKYGSKPVVPKGFEASETIKSVFKNKTYYRALRGTGAVGTDGLVFELLPSFEEFAVQDYNGDAVDVVIPSVYENLPVTKIMKDAFKDANHVKSIYIPNSINQIEPNAFRGIENLNTITLEEGNTVYFLDSMGALAWNEDFYGELYSHLLYVPSGKVDLLEISEDYFYIDDGALANTNATILKISSTCFLNFLDIFGDNYNNNVKQIILTSGYLRHNMCENMTNLMSVTVYEAPNNYDDPDYEGKNFGDEVDYNCFAGCTSLRGISLPSIITSINDEAFKDCTSLEDVILGFGDLSITNMGKDVFKNCPKIKGFEKDGVVYLGNNEHKYQVPVKIIEENLVENLEIPAEALLIPDYFFQRNQVLRDLSFEEGCRLKTIGDYAFSICSNLDLYSEKHYLPESVEEVGYKAFANTDFDDNDSAWLWINVSGTNYKYCMVSLKKNCTEFELGKYCKFIDAYGIRRGYSSVTNPYGNSTFSIHYNDVLLNSYVILHTKRTNTQLLASNFAGSIPYLAHIAPYCFYNQELTSCVLVDKTATGSNRKYINHIGEFAFYYCKLNANVYLCDYCEYVGGNAFYQGIATNVTFNITSRLTYVGDSAFKCDSYGFTLKFQGSEIPATWDRNFDGEQGSNTKNTYQYNQ